MPQPTRSSVILVLVVAACGASSGVDPGSATDSSSGGGDTAATTAPSSSTGIADGTTGATSSTGGTSDDGGPPIIYDVGGTKDHPTDDLTCSSDLKNVLSGSGSLVEACGPDEGCLAGACVPACDAAAGSKGSTGCRFVIPTSPFFANDQIGVSQAGPCHALLVSNTWDRPAQIELSRGGESYDVAAVTRLPSGLLAATTYDDLPASGIPSGQVAVVFVSHRPGVNNGSTLECPITPAVLEDTAAHGTTTGVAFELESDTPLQVYDIIPYGGASTYLPSASLIFPSTAWGNDYLAVTPHEATGPEWLLVVARENGTTVTINPTAPFAGGSIENPPVGSATEYSLGAGEFVQFLGNADAGGTIVTGSKPIGMFSGNAYLAVTTADNPVSGQDSAHQMIPDVNALGSEYVGAGLLSRLAAFAPESVRYRITGVVDGTDLTWDADPPIGAPDTLDAGEIVEFESRDLFTVRSQGDDFPFSLAQYMSGTLDGQPGCSGSPGLCQLGDDDWVVLVPPQQFLQRYAFFVDPTYATSSLVVTRRRGAGGFASVDLECLGNIDGWMPVGNDGVYEVAHVELFRSGVGMEPACQTSQHLASSAGDFGVVVWGTDQASSYGYPAGGGLDAINGVVLDPQG